MDFCLPFKIIANKFIEYVLHKQNARYPTDSTVVRINHYTPIEIKIE